MAHILTRSAWVFVTALLCHLVPAAVAGEPKGPPKQSLKEYTKVLLKKAEEEYRIFFKRPEQIHEFWAAIKLEIELGKYDIAALHLDQLMQKLAADKDGDVELLKLEEVEGLSSFLRLQKIRQWSDHAQFQKIADANVKGLLDRLSVALDKHLADPERIRKLVDALDGKTPEERAYAFAQLDRSGERATPTLVDELQKSVGKVRHRRIIDAMVKMGDPVVPPLFEVFNARDPKDAADADLRLALLEIIQRRGDKRAIPHLWHLSEATRYPPEVRKRAKEVLATLHETDIEKLPPAKVALTEQAERLYQHKVRFLDPKRVRVWFWLPDRRIEPKAFELPAATYEHVFADRFAKFALDLDPKYRPAQLLSLMLTLERAHDWRLDETLIDKIDPPKEDPKGEPGKPDPQKEAIQKADRALAQLLVSVDADLVMEALDRALAERNVAVIIPLVKALGRRGEARAARPGFDGTPGPLVRALNFPDRRVQFAAATAMLNMPTPPAPAAAARVVEILRRFMLAAPAPKVLILHAPDARHAELRKTFQAAGYDTEFAPNLNRGFEHIRRAADIDLIVIHHAAPRNELPFLLSQLRADSDVGLLPLFVMQPLQGGAAPTQLMTRYRNVTALPEVLLTMPDDLKNHLASAVKLASVPDSVARATDAQRPWLEDNVRERRGQALSVAERHVLAGESLDLLWKMARGLIKGYDVRPTELAWVEALRDDATAAPAIEVLASFPGSAQQARLAGVVADPKRKVRVNAAAALNRHVARHGVLLSRAEIERMQRLYSAEQEDPEVRAQLAVLMGHLRPTAEQTGKQLLK